MRKLINNSRKTVILKSIKASLGLMLCGAGLYMTINAGIGLSSWDVLHFGLAKTFGMKYGTVSVLTAFVVVLINIVLKEQIGLGMILDALIVGKTVDFLDYMDIIQKQESLTTGVLLMLCGITVIGFSQYIYMSAALGCGPRDGLLVGIARRCSKLPIGIVATVIFTTVTFFGWLLGGNFGPGTLIFAFLAGPVMQLDFKLVGFDATSVKHQNMFETVRTFSKKKQIIQIKNNVRYTVYISQ